MATFNQIYGAVLTARTERTAADAVVEQDRDKLTADTATAQQKLQSQTSAESTLTDSLPEGQAFLAQDAHVVVVKIHGMISEIPLGDGDIELGPPVIPQLP